MTKEEISLKKWILKLFSIPYVSVYFINDLFFFIKRHITFKNQLDPMKKLFLKKYAAKYFTIIIDNWFFLIFSGQKYHFWTIKLSDRNFLLGRQENCLYTGPINGFHDFFCKNKYSKPIF